MYSVHCACYGIGKEIVLTLLKKIHQFMKSSREINYFEILKIIFYMELNNHIVKVYNILNTNISMVFKIKTLYIVLTI